MKTGYIVRHVICLILFFLLGLLIYNSYDCIEPFDTDETNDIHEPNGTPNVKWPFINLKDETGKNINMLGVKAYIDNDENRKAFLKHLKDGHKFIGISSYVSFPKECLNKHGYCHDNKNNMINDKHIEDYVLGWCHCFKEPEKYIRGNRPRILISESDFNAENLEMGKEKIKYDFICVQPKDDKCERKWHSFNKNWPLAEKCIKVLVDELNLKGIIVGREDCPINVINKKNIETTGSLKYDDCINKIRQSRFMLLPNFEDASPRVLSESLVLNKPILVNDNILGGWKYVNDKTGIFFNGNNIKEQCKKLLNNIERNQYTPREYYINNYGIENTGKQLKDFLEKINPDLSECKKVRFDYA